MKKNIYIYIYIVAAISNKLIESSNFVQLISLSTTPKNIRKALVFPCFQGS